MKKTLKRIFCSMLSISLVCPFVSPALVYAQEENEVEVVEEVEMVEEEKSETVLLDQIKKIEIQEREDFENEVSIDIHVEKDFDLSKAKLKIEGFESVELEEPEKDEEEDFFTFKGEFEPGSYKVASLLVKIDDKEEEIDLSSFQTHFEVALLVNDKEEETTTEEEEEVEDSEETKEEEKEIVVDDVHCQEEEEIIVQEDEAISYNTYISRAEAFIHDARWNQYAYWPQIPPKSDKCYWKYVDYPPTGCYAYCLDFVAEVFNERMGWTRQYDYSIKQWVDNFTQYYSPSQIQSGDVIELSGHYFVVITRSGNTLYTCEGATGYYSPDGVYIGMDHYEIRNGSLYDLWNNTYLYFVSGSHYNLLSGMIEDNEAPKISNVQVTDITAEGYTVTCKVTDNIGIGKVAFPTWTTKNGQDDIQADWPTNPAALGSIDSNGNVRYRVNVADHNYETGCEYNTHIYAYDEVGNISGFAIPVIFVPTADDLVAGYSLSLSGDIGVNFYMTLSLQTTDDLNSKVRMTLPNGTVSEIFVKDAQREGDYYIFPCRVSAKDMTKTITAELVDGQGSVIKTFKYTVEDYANYLISHASSYDAKSVNIAKAMMTYGKYVQQYFGYNTSNVPKNVNSLENVDLSQYQAIINDKSNQIDFVGAQLLLTSKPGLQLYFTGDAQFKVNGESVEVSKSGKYTVVTIPSIASMDELFMITAPNFTMRYGIFSYGYQALSQSTNTSLKNLVKAMYAYHQALYN